MISDIMRVAGLFFILHIWLCFINWYDVPFLVFQSTNRPRQFQSAIDISRTVSSVRPRIMWAPSELVLFDPNISLWSSKFLSLHDSLHDFSILRTTKLIMRIVYQYAQKQMAGQILLNCYKCCLVHMMRHISTRWDFTESTLRLQNVFFFFRCWNPE